jgi:hypothetical protein
MLIRKKLGHRQISELVEIKEKQTDALFPRAKPSTDSDKGDDKTRGA